MELRLEAPQPTVTDRIYPDLKFRASQNLPQQHQVQQLPEMEMTQPEIIIQTKMRRIGKSDV